MIFSWFSATTPSNDIVTTTKEEDGWVQIITEEHQVVPVEEPMQKEQDVAVPAQNEQEAAVPCTPSDLAPTTNSTSTTTAGKKLSRQERRYQARIAQQQAKKAAVAGEDQLKAALKRSRQKKQMLEKWNTTCLPNSSSFALD